MNGRGTDPAIAAMFGHLQIRGGTEAARLEAGSQAAARMFEQMRAEAAAWPGPPDNGSYSQSSSK